MYVFILSIFLLDYGHLLAIDPLSIALGLGALASGVITTLENRAQNLSNQELSEKMFNKNREWQVLDQQKQQDWTKELMQYQYDTFSSPSSQMDAYKKAGLNPWLLGQGHDIGSGQSVNPQGNSLPSGGLGIPDIRTTPLDNPVTGGFNTILQGSAIQNQRLSALSDILKSSPDAFKALGKRGFDSVMRSLFGDIVDSSLLDRISKSNAMIAEHKEVVASVESHIAAHYGVKDAQNKIALQEQNFNKMAAEIGLMSSENRLNDAKINELMSSYVRNLADAWKLRQEGSYFVANADTVNAIRELTVSSLQVELTKASFENRIKGYYEGSGLDKYLNGSYHSDKTSDILRIQENAEGSELVKAFDRVLGKYLKVSAAP